MVKYLLALLAPLAIAAAPAPEPSCADNVCIKVTDLSPKFLAFYREASAQSDLAPDARFVLWKQRYGFAAVPPGPRGDPMARQLLDSAWPKYPAAIPLIERGAVGMTPDPQATMRRVARLLKLDEPVNITLIAYVGGFESNAFTFGSASGATVAFPIEMSPEERVLIVPHETTHAIHLHLAKLSGGWERSIAQTIMMEGLAMRATQALEPGRPEQAYVTHRPAWWDEVSGKRDAILADMLPVLDAKDGESVYRFTIGKGPAGVEREAYYAGWLVIGELQRGGMSLAQIARIPEPEMTATVRGAIERLRTRR